MPKECPFCEPDNIIIQNEEAVAIYDGYPVTKRHMLVVSREHCANFFNLDWSTKRDMLDLVDALSVNIHSDDIIDGYNVGINVGAAAGQTVPHAHIHLIPRRNGDHPNPRGGVRAVIPGKANY